MIEGEWKQVKICVILRSWGIVVGISMRAFPREVTTAVGF